MHAPLTQPQPGPLAPWATTATGWRYQPATVTFHEHTVLAGGPLLALSTYAISQARNATTRANAATAAAPTWRTLGALELVVETDRLLVHHDRNWAVVWLGSVTELHHHPDRSAVELRFTGDDPYWIETPDAARLAAHVSHFLTS